jgi:K+-sensing histidine kinase KdpD
VKSIGGRVAVALIGAVAGCALALILEFIGHPTWYILAMGVAAVAPSVTLELARWPKFDAFRERCRYWPRWSRYGIILLLIAIPLATKRILDSNSAHYGYLPLLAPVIAIAVLFGFRSALAAVALSILATDLFFVVPPSSFAWTNAEDVVGVLLFAVLGAITALAVDGFVNIDPA